jgi:hypothetical protein
MIGFYGGVQTYKRGAHSTHGYYGTIGYYRVLRVLWYYKQVLCSTHEYYVVTQTGYYKVLQIYTTEGMSRVMVRVRIRFFAPHAWYLSFLIAISNKMARAFAEGVTTSKTMSLERCGLKKNPVRVRVRVRVKVKVS